MSLDAPPELLQTLYDEDPLGDPARYGLYANYKYLHHALASNPNTPSNVLDTYVAYSDLADKLTDNIGADSDQLDRIVNDLDNHSLDLCIDSLSNVALHPNTSEKTLRTLLSRGGEVASLVARREDLSDDMEIQILTNLKSQQNSTLTKHTYEAGYHTIARSYDTAWDLIDNPSMGREAKEFVVGSDQVRLKRALGRGYTYRGRFGVCTNER